MPDSAPIPHLAVAIVCKNNEATIGRTLEAVRALAGRIVAVDSGSTDGTIALLEAAGAEVVRSDWLGHVRTKQKALELADRPWALCLDSDESPDDELCADIRRRLHDPQAGGVSAFALRRKVWYRDRPLNYAWQPEWRVRLVRAGSARWGGHDPHDALLPVDASARVERLSGVLRHDSFATFAEHLRKQWAHADVAARSARGAGRRTSALRMCLSPAGAMAKQVVLKRAFLDGVGGWLAAGSTAAGTLMKHMILLELQHAGEGSSPKPEPRQPPPAEPPQNPQNPPPAPARG